MATLTATDLDAYVTPQALRDEWLDYHGLLEPRPILDRPSDAPAWLDALMRNALQRLHLCSDGAIQRFGSDADLRKGKGGAKARTPTSDLAREIDVYDHVYRKARTNRVRLSVVKRTQDAARDAVRVSPERVRGTQEWRMAIRNDERSVRAVARAYGVSIGTVSNIRNGR